MTALEQETEYPRKPWDTRHQDQAADVEKAERLEREARELLTDSAPFVALYFGTCSDCGGRIKPGQDILRHPDGSYGHAQPSECNSRDLPPLTARERLCGRCFCYHAGECA